MVSTHKGHLPMSRDLLGVLSGLVVSMGYQPIACWIVGFNVEAWVGGVVVY